MRVTPAAARRPKALQQGRERRGLENLVVGIYGILIGRTLAVENVTLVLDGSSNRGSTTMRARHGPPESSRELGTLEHGSTLNEIRHSPEYCSAEQTFLLVRDSIPYIHDGEADDTTHMTSDLEIAYLNRNGPMSITYDLLLGTIVFNYHFDSGLVVNDDGKIVSVIDFTGKVLVLLTTADAQRCLIDRARVDAPGGLGKTNSRFARFVPVRFNSKIPDLFDQAAGWHKIVPEDFTLRLNAASLP